MNKSEKLLTIRYKPLMFNDYIVNSETIDIIRIFLDINHLNLILYGGESSGKTTLLNTIINEYYKDYTYKERSDNILYINNLDEQGIPFYRNEVKTFCQTCSNIYKKKKMVIIDDIDNINEQSQQVFRNYIDAYSKNVFFILSCTIIQKVIDNIQSQLQIIKIQPFKESELKTFIIHIRDKEQIPMDDSVIDYILHHSNYNIQLLIHYMEKFYLLTRPKQPKTHTLSQIQTIIYQSPDYFKELNKITIEKVQELCFNISFNILDEYIKLIKEEKLYEAIEFIIRLFNKGYSVIDILDTFYIYVKFTLLLTEKEKYDIIPLICKYITIFYNIHEDEIELVFLTNNLQSILSV